MHKGLMMKLIFPIFLLLLCLSLQLFAAQPTSGPCAVVKNRPCIALVLGGGGARGGAHVGVLKQLELQQVPVDLIVGTSIGAYVGGLYAQGHSPAAIEKMLLHTDWGLGFRDRVARDEMPVRRKQQKDDFPINLDIGVDASGVKLPKGVLHGQSMAALIRHAYGVVPELASFDGLAIPFRAVATNLVNRAEVVLDHGSLLQAVQASMSIPGVVRPMELNGLWLVDGGVANNLPVSVAKALGADRVIAVAIDAPLLEQDELNSAVAITEQLTSFLVREAVERQLALLEPGDILLKPKLEQIGTLEFERIAEAIRAGFVNAKAQQQAFAALSQPEIYAGWRQQHRQKRQLPLKLSGVELDNQTALADEVLLKRLDLTPGQLLSKDELSQALHRVYGLDTMERVSSNLQRKADGQQLLQVQALEKSWGPAYLNFRLQLQDDFRNTHNYQLAASYLWTGLSPYGAEWQTDIALGTDKNLQTELYWPLAASGFYTAARLAQQRTVLGLESDQGLSDGELTNSELLLSSELGYELSDHSRMSLALLQKDGQYILPAGVAATLGFNSFSYLRRGVASSWSWDNLDSVSFPSRGLKLDLTVQRMQDNVFQSRTRSVSSMLQLQGARRFGTHVLRSRLRWDTFNGDAGVLALEQYSLGGLLNLSGYPKAYLFGSEVRFGSLVYLYQLNDSKFSFFNAPFYLGASLERGAVYQPRFNRADGVAGAGWIWAGSIFAGWDSPFGPLYLGYGQAQATTEQQPYRFYLSLGQTF